MLPTRNLSVHASHHAASGNISDQAKLAFLRPVEKADPPDEHVTTMRASINAEKLISRACISDWHCGHTLSLS
jgi:hypothetical protein